VDSVSGYFETYRSLGLPDITRTAEEEEILENYGITEAFGHATCCNTTLESDYHHRRCALNGKGVGMYMCDKGNCAKFTHVDYQNQDRYACRFRLMCTGCVVRRIVEHPGERVLCQGCTKRRDKPEITLPRPTLRGFMLYLHSTDNLSLIVKQSFAYRWTGMLLRGISQKKMPQQVLDALEDTGSQLHTCFKACAIASGVYSPNIISSLHTVADSFQIADNVSHNIPDEVLYAMGYMYMHRMLDLETDFRLSFKQVPTPKGVAPLLADIVKKTLEGCNKNHDVFSLLMRAILGNGSRYCLASGCLDGIQQLPTQKPMSAIVNGLDLCMEDCNNNGSKFGHGAVPQLAQNGSKFGHNESEQIAQSCSDSRHHEDALLNMQTYGMDLGNMITPPASPGMVSLNLLTPTKNLCNFCPSSPGWGTHDIGYTIPNCWYNDDTGKENDSLLACLNTQTGDAGASAGKENDSLLACINTQTVDAGASASGTSSVKVQGCIVLKLAGDITIDFCNSEILNNFDI
jgi:hypothetical protein